MLLNQINPQSQALCDSFLTRGIYEANPRVFQVFFRVLTLMTREKKGYFTKKKYSLVICDEGVG